MKILHVIYQMEPFQGIEDGQEDPSPIFAGLRRLIM